MDATRSLLNAASNLPLDATSGVAKSSQGLEQKSALFQETLAQSSAAQGIGQPDVISKAGIDAAGQAEAAISTRKVADSTAVERTKHSLNLDSNSNATSGDSILSGLIKMRGVVDEQHGKIASLAKTNISDSNAFMEMQLEVAKYSALLDVSSKLAGKASQTVDQLMKGQ